VTITVDGARLRAPKNSSVLDIALDYGICIPHLCHMRGILPYGVCRLCIVEVIKGNDSKITTSCTLDVKEGMVIRAHSEKILKLRQNIAEMLVAEAPNSRAIQDIAVRCGVKKVRYPFRNKNCVLCGRCVRVCSQVWQSKSLGFVGRGYKRHVALPFDKRPEFCKRCNACIDNCPITITPCPGPMKKGKEALCGLCESQLSMSEQTPDTCAWCRLGKGFNCIRYRP
jgi:NADH dehydrogenase/NADH:ubiquinone oxidoreductase subunit G